MLTIEELRQMHGEPVWIVEYPNYGHWELSENAEDYFEDRDEKFYGMSAGFYLDPEEREGQHKLGWAAFSQKPSDNTWNKRIPTLSKDDFCTAYATINRAIDGRLRAIRETRVKARTELFVEELMSLIRIRSWLEVFKCST